MPRIRKSQRAKAIAALTTAGMDPAMAKSASQFLDLDAELGPQIEALAEEDPELFGLDADGNPVEDEDPEDDRPMTAREAQIARLRGVHRLAPERPEGTTSAARNASALGAGRARNARTSTAPATAQKAAERLRAGVGRAADL